MQDVLVLGTADWDQAIATNQHYMVRELAKDSQNRINFVESLGLRRPQLSARDAKRVMRRLTNVQGRTDSARRAVPANVTVTSPKVIPHHRGTAFQLNRLLIERQTRSWATSPARRVLWTYSPITYGLERYADVAIYHCVDLLGQFPGIDPDLIDRHERRLAQNGTMAIASSRVVAEHLLRQGFNDPVLWENVADTEVFASSSFDNVTRIPRSAIFAGNLTSNKVDFDLLLALQASGIAVTVAGPVAEGGGEAEGHVRRLVDAGINHLGILTITQLAREVRRFSVGLIPYQINRYTLGVSPLKTYEYLAAGLPVVTTALPGVLEDAEDIFKEESTEAFVARVNSLCEDDDQPARLRRESKATPHSWIGRGELARSVVRGEHLS